jgi:very-short-patch-repair endonuclease
VNNNGELIAPSRLDEVREEFADKIAHHIGNTAYFFLRDAVEKRCESEIEKMMVGALMSHPTEIDGSLLFSNGMWNYVFTGQWSDHISDVISKSFTKRGAFIFLQQGVGKYRADFVVVGIPADGIAAIPVVVECDGHDFHERTKEQAARDKKRDRFMTCEGYRVFRFSGSEIWKNPRACAEEVMDFLSAEMTKAVKAKAAGGPHETP